MSKENTETNSSFGYKKVDPQDKQKMVDDVFDKVHENYDLMNDILSLGLHRLWKRVAVNAAKIRSNFKVLDLAGGTGDLTTLISKKINEKGLMLLSDINMNMLIKGKNNLIDKGVLNFSAIQLDAHSLPFYENSFDLITIAFGLRNITDKEKALSSILYCLKPGGNFMILEFSKPKNEMIREIYDIYSFEVMPKIGEIIAKDGDSYQYLAESIRMYPPPEEMKELMKKIGFVRCKYEYLTQGIVSIHSGFKPTKVL